MTVGSLPHSNIDSAWDLILSRTPELPAWPQLPRRSFYENMYVQFSERFPGLQMDEENERIWVDRQGDLDPELEQLYTAYLDEDLSHASIGSAYAAGLANRPAKGLRTAQAIKGHVTGPVSWGLTVTDENRRPILYDEVLADAVARHLRLKARWQEQLLQQINPNSIIFLDEPYMSSFGSAYVALGREQVITLMEEVLGGIQGLKGVHCCGNTDWSLLLATSIDILSLDAYSYAENLALYPDELRAFLDRGGIIAWGIVPNSHEVRSETVASLVERLHAAMNLLVRKGISWEQLLESALVTPACGLGPLPVEEAERGVELMAGVSAAMRDRHL
jgi:methionine synthase II (cobalamin-independent)